MPDVKAAPEVDLTRLEERTQRLARDKSYLQLIINLMNKVGAAEGLEGVVAALLGNILDVIGGTNIALYYGVDHEIRYADLMGARRKIEAVDDELVRRVFESREAVELVHDFRDTRMQPPVSGNAYTWAVPLLAGKDLVGVLKLENLHVAMRELYEHLPTFFTYVASVLKNEILSLARLELAAGHARFLEGLDAVNRAIQRASDVDRMMSDVLDVVLSVFACDRAFLMVPCDPEAPSWRVPMERNRPEYPGVLAQGLEIPMDAEVARTLRELLASDRPVKFGPETDHPPPEDVARQFGFRSFMSIAIHPKVGKPWQFGIHQCSHARVWTDEEERLLQEIGRRLADGLTSLLARRGLQESEANYRRIVDTAVEGVWVLDADTRTSFVNAAMAAMLGYAPDEMIGHAPTDFMVEEDVPAHLESLERRRQGASEIYERRFRRKDGEIVCVLASATSFLGADRRFQGSFAMVSDITGRKRAEEALRESEAQLNEAQRIAQVGSWELDIVSNKLIWSDQIYKVFEIDRDKFGASYEAFLDAIHPDDREAVHLAYTNSLESRTPYSVEHRLLFEGGRIKYVHEQCETFYDADGKPVRSAGTVQDITDRKRAEESLQKSEEKYRLITENAGEAIFITQEGRITYANEATSRLTGYPLSELTSQSFTILIHPDDRDLVVERHRRRLAGEDVPSRYEFRLVTRDGAPRWVEINAVATTWEGRPATLSLLADITGRKRAEEERQANLLFFENLDRVNQAIQRTNDLDQMMKDVLDELLAIFGCDRAWFVIPCDPDAPSFRVPMERTRPEYPGAQPAGQDVPMFPGFANVCRALLASDSPVQFGAGAPQEVPAELAGMFGVRSQVAMALYPKNRSPYAFGLHQCSHARAWTAQEERLLQEIGRRLSDSLTVLLAHRDLARLSRAQRMLSDSNQTLLHATDEATLLNQVCQLVVEEGGYLLAWVGYAEHDEAKTIRPVACCGFEAGYLESVGLTWGDSPRGRGPGGVAIRSGEPSAARNICDDPAFAPWRDEALKRGFRSVLALPLCDEERAFGALGIYSAEPNAFDDQEVAVLRELAADLAFGIVTLRTRAERDRAEAAKAIQTRISAMFLSISDEETFGEVLNVVLDVMHSPLGALGYLDEAGDLIVPTLTRQVWDKCQVPDKSVVFARDAWGDSTFGQAIRERRPIVVNAPTDRLPKGHLPLQRHVALPVVFRDETIGLFLVANKETDYDDRDLETLADIARHVAPILAARLQLLRDNEELRKRNDEQTALRTIDQSITGSLDLRLMLRVIVDQAMTHLKADAVSVLLVNPHSLLLEYAAGKGFRSRAFERTCLKMGEGRAGRAALERRPLGSPDLRVEDVDVPRDRQPFQTEGFLAHHVAPLVAKGRVLGVLEIFHRQPFRPRPEWMGFYEALADQTAIAIDSATAFNDLQQTNVALRLSYDATIEGWARALDLRDKETEGHSRRVTDLTVRVARTMFFPPESIVHVQRGALLHDIGKMGIPDAILLKPGPLTDEEWVIMRRHPQLALEMLRPIEHLRPALDIPLCHHEKWDGTGYPRGLKDEQIPLSARIFAVVDVWDALTNDRPYRKAWGREKVLGHIRDQAGEHFDPQVVEAFLETIEDGAGTGS